jgi:putative ABC transport system permease protein
VTAATSISGVPRSSGTPGVRGVRRRRRLWPRGYGFAVSGIAVGIAGLIALGGLAERIGRFIEGGHRFVLGQISVAGAGLGSGAGFTAGGLLPARALAALRQVPGVRSVQAQVMLPFSPGTSELFTVNQELVLGLDLRVPGPNRNYPSYPIARGRFLRADERGAAVVGADFAAAHHLDVDGRVRIGGRDFAVVGVMERLLTAPDRFVLVSLEDGRDLWLGVDPMLRTVFGVGGLYAREDLNTGAAVGWLDGVDPDALSARIRTAVPEVNVATPGEVARQLAASTTFFRWLLGGVAGIGLLIGGLSLSNTVAAATFERIRDFGIRQALGATDAALLGEVVRESLAVSLAGGALGLLLALGGGALADLRAARAGQQLFLFSGRLLGGALVFAGVLGVIAGLYATARILRVPPAEAIRRGT